MSMVSDLFILLDRINLIVKIIIKLHSIVYFTFSKHLSYKYISYLKLFRSVMPIEKSDCVIHMGTSYVFILMGGT